MAPSLALVQRKVDEHRARVRDGPLHLLDPGPSTGDLEQTLLNQVFRLCEVPGDQVGRPQQGLSRFGDEAVEVNRGASDADVRPLLTSTLLCLRKVASSGKAGENVGTACR